MVEILILRKPDYVGDYAADPFDTIGIDTSELLDGDGTAYNGYYQRIVRGLIGLILMSPDAMRR